MTWLMRLGGLAIAALAGFTAMAGEVQPLAWITVEAGNHARTNTPLSVRAEGLSLPEKGVVLEELNGTKRVSVPVQVEAETPRRLSWILSGTTPAGAVRVFQLVPGAGRGAAGVEVRRSASGVEILCGAKKVLRYNSAAAQRVGGADQKLSRGAFIHPLWSPGGTVVTGVLPGGPAPLMGIWMGWPTALFEGREVDFWNLGKGEGTVQFRKLESTVSGPVFGGFRARHDYVDLTAPGGKKAALHEVWETRVWNVGGAKAGYWLWDLISIQDCATTSPVHMAEFLDGGLGLCGAKEWSEKTAGFLTSEGKPRQDGPATRSRWCDLSGRTKGQWAGVTVLSHPRNFRHPEPTRIGPQGSVSFNFAPSQLGEWAMGPDVEYVFRYRFHVHDGQPRPEEAERLWADFADPPLVKIAKLIQKAQDAKHGTEKAEP